MQRQLTLIDRLLCQVDTALRTLVPGTSRADRDNPAAGVDSTSMSDSERRHAAGLMRVNHTGEVCAQALYQGQALTAKLPVVRGEMEQAAREEVDHLVWCEERLDQLGSRTSLLNPVFYGLSFGLGAAAGIAGDRWSLGFVAATEDQVCEHLREHLKKMPAGDQQSRAILEKMLSDEQAHGTHALEAGGRPFSSTGKRLMRAASKVMTSTTYRL